MAIQPLTTRTSGLAADTRPLDALKLQAAKDTPGAIKEAARQFEALFMRELIKSMREATMKSGLLDSATGDLGQDLLDDQLALQMSGQPGGLSDLIARQLSQRVQGAAVPVAAAPAAPAGTPSGGAAVAPTRGHAEFVARHAEVAQRVAQASGIPADFMLGQAGHESGWGRQEIRMADGSPSHNLFGIKAGPGWTGKVAEVTTTEYVNGAPQKVVARFRAYDSYEASFRDFSRLITQSPRYAGTTRQLASVQGYASSLQNSGYATDPAYAAKLSRAINLTLQVRRAQA